MTWAYDDHDFDHLGMFRNVHLSKNMPYAFMVYGCYFWNESIDGLILMNKEQS